MALRLTSLAIPLLLAIGRISPHYSLESHHRCSSQPQRCD